MPQLPELATTQEANMNSPILSLHNPMSLQQHTMMGLVVAHSIMACSTP
jgi:hypothetical protein